jgi:uncharacterized protein (TIGR02145 family)
MYNFLIHATRLFAVMLILFIFGCDTKNPTAVDQTSTNDLEIKNRDLDLNQPLCVDADGNVYKVIKIGDQWWMAENLRVTHFRNLDPIAEVTESSQWSTMNAAAYCYYANNTDLDKEYGLLYNWKAVTDSRNIAPKGWHVATDKEYTILENFLGGRDVAGSKMKEEGNRHWAYPNLADNSSGFTALPGGYRDSRGDFMGWPGFAFFWTATPAKTSGSLYRYLDHIYVESFRVNGNKKFGFSVRCVRDKEENRAFGPLE